MFDVAFVLAFTFTLDVDQLGGRTRPTSWMLDVGCWMLDVLSSNSHRKTMTRATLLTTILLPTLAMAQDIRPDHHAPTKQRTPLYTCTKPPLHSAPFTKLPITSIKPHGWLRHQLDLMREGMTGRLPEVSQGVKFEGNAWA